MKIGIHDQPPLNSKVETVIESRMMVPPCAVLFLILDLLPGEEGRLPLRAVACVYLPRPLLYSPVSTPSFLRFSTLLCFFWPFLTTRLFKISFRTKAILLFALFPFFFPFNKASCLALKSQA